MTQQSGGTFDAADVQAWIDSLGPREAAMLAHAVGDREMRAAIEALGAAAEFVADLARKHAAKGKRKASTAVREVVGTILRVQRDAQRAHAEHCGKPPAPEPDPAPAHDPSEIVRFDGPGAEFDDDLRIVRTWPGGGGNA